METDQRRIGQNKIMMDEMEVRDIVLGLHPLFELTGQFGDWAPTPTDCDYEFLVITFKDIRDGEEYVIPILKNEKLRLIGPLTFLTPSDFAVQKELDDGGEFFREGDGQPVAVKKSYFISKDCLMEVFSGGEND